MIYIWILALHFIADFLCQSREMALKKSVDKHILFNHCFIIFIVLSLGTFNILFALFNAITHAFIDWNIWRVYRINKQQDFEFWKDHWFYVTIGFDQLLHTSLLMLSWSLL